MFLGNDVKVEIINIEFKFTVVTTMTGLRPWVLLGKAAFLLFNVRSKRVCFAFIPVISYFKDPL